MLYRVKLGSIYVSNPQDHCLDFGAGGAAYAFGFGVQAGDLGTAGLNVFHDGALYVEGRERYLQATKFFAVDVALHDLAADGVHLLTPQSRIDEPGQVVGICFFSRYS